MLQKELCRRLQYFTLSGFDSGKSINFAAEIKEDRLASIENGEWRINHPEGTLNA